MAKAATAEAPTAQPATPAKPELKVVPETNKLPGASDRFSIRESSFAYPEIDVTIPVEHTVEDALKREYWVHHAHKLKRPAFSGGSDRVGALIYLRRDDHNLFALLYVRAIMDGSLIVGLVGQPVYFGPKDSVDTERHTARWSEAKIGYDIIRKADQQLVGDGSRIKTLEMAADEIRRLEA